ncbi:hypothetical protein K488DRAFT_71267 [Vararia minispora EC-137]|uniref:Uncharacterized protein n=1 Tax=Vararia minispora EC-137 TaxID=1314806 RepID=A0ACB8QJ20_9AGAM|nr:hypothetical protein K488DRAFT_71267 [Vararia minispora EC-137]
MAARLLAVAVALLSLAPFVLTQTPPACVSHSNTTCLCTNMNFPTDGGECLALTCAQSDLPAAESTFAALCGVVVTSAPSTASSSRSVLSGTSRSPSTSAPSSTSSRSSTAPASSPTPAPPITISSSSSASASSSTPPAPAASQSAPSSTRRNASVGLIGMLLAALGVLIVAGAAGKAAGEASLGAFRIAPDAPSGVLVERHEVILPPLSSFSRASVRRAAFLVRRGRARKTPVVLSSVRARVSGAGVSVSDYCVPRAASAVRCRQRFSSAIALPTSAHRTTNAIGTVVLILSIAMRRARSTLRHGNR